MVVARLSSQGHVVRVLTRDAGRAEGPDADVVIGDVRDPRSVAAATRGCSRVVSAVHGFLGGQDAGPNHIDHQGNTALLHAAVDADVEHVVLASVFDARPTIPLNYIARSTLQSWNSRPAH
jgi:uncharacterized protein YbjT (DUF2867 family)